MDDAIATGTDSLTDEIARYLAAVELFRSLGCEPCWLPEATTRPAAPQVEPPPVAVVRSAH
jgi:hypothetical protein